MSSAATKTSMKCIDHDSGLTFQHLDSNSGDVIGSQTVRRRLHDLSEGSRSQNRTYGETQNDFRMIVTIKLMRFKENNKVLDPV